MGWVLLRMQAQSQNKYMELMAERQPHIELYYPLYDKVTRPARARRAVRVRSPVYPGYVFADISRIHGLEDLRPGLIRVWCVRFGAQIAIIDSRVIDVLRLQEAQGLLVTENKADNPYTYGRHVRVHTPMADIMAIVVRLTNNGTRIVVNGPLCPITVPLHQVELV